MLRYFCVVVVFLFTVSFTLGRLYARSNARSRGFKIITVHRRGGHVPGGIQKEKRGAENEKMRRFFVYYRVDK